MSTTRMSIGRSRAKLTAEEGTGVTFRDVAGVDEAVDELHHGLHGVLDDHDGLARLGQASQHRHHLLHLAAAQAGVVLRPNNSLAGVLGSSGCSSGGSGFGSIVPRSCAAAAPQARQATAATPPGRRPAQATRPERKARRPAAEAAPATETAPVGEATVGDTLTMWRDKPYFELTGEGVRVKDGRDASGWEKRAAAANRAGC